MLWMSILVLVSWEIKAVSAGPDNGIGPGEENPGNGPGRIAGPGEENPGTSKRNNNKDSTNAIESLNSTNAIDNLILTIKEHVPASNVTSLHDVMVAIEIDTESPNDPVCSTVYSLPACSVQNITLIEEIFIQLNISIDELYGKEATNTIIHNSDEWGLSAVIDFGVLRDVGYEPLYSSVILNTTPVVEFTVAMNKAHSMVIQNDINSVVFEVSEAIPAINVSTYVEQIFANLMYNPNVDAEAYDAVIKLADDVEIEATILNNVTYTHFIIGYQNITACDGPVDAVDLGIVCTINENIFEEKTDKDMFLLELDTAVGKTDFGVIVESKLIFAAAP